MQRYSLFQRLCAILVVAIFVLLVQIGFLYAHYDAVVTAQSFSEQKTGVTYKLVRNGTHPYKMLIGDLLGVNTASAAFVQDYTPQSTAFSWILITGLQPATGTPITEDNFFPHISTANGIVLADNFCTQEWAQIKDKELYQKSSLSPGPFCFSEPESIFVDQLIKTFAPVEIILPYDVPLYKNYIGNFLDYLDQTRIKYRTVPLDDLKKENP